MANLFFVNFFCYICINISVVFELSSPGNTFIPYICSPNFIVAFYQVGVSFCIVAVAFTPAPQLMFQRIAATAKYFT